MGDTVHVCEGEWGVRGDFCASQFKGPYLH